jgi:hypothetical protein
LRSNTPQVEEECEPCRIVPLMQRVEKEQDEKRGIAINEQEGERAE